MNALERAILAAIDERGPGSGLVIERRIQLAQAKRPWLERLAVLAHVYMGGLYPALRALAEAGVLDRHEEESVPERFGRPRFVYSRAIPGKGIAS